MNFFLNILAFVSDDPLVEASSSSDILAIVMGVLTFGLVFGGLIACFVIAFKKKKQG